MRGYGLWWAAALVVASSLSALGLAALNRSGEPEAVLVLTERELRLPAKQTDNTALALELAFERRRGTRADGAAGNARPREAGWFDRAKLEAIGFDCRAPATPDQTSHYRSQPPRSTYAALEYEGEAWCAEIQEPGAQDPLLDTHLVAIDVDNDPAALRQRHPDRRHVAIVEATAVLQFVSNPGQPPFLRGRVTAVLPGEINVPRAWRQPLERLQSDRPANTLPPPLHEPRYRVTVTWGSRLEPWIASVEPLAAAPAR